MTSTTAHGKKPLSTISQSFCRFISLMLTAMSTGQREEKRVGSGKLRGRYSYRTILCDMNNVPLRGLNSSINL